MNQLRQHMSEHHPNTRQPHSNMDLIRVHSEQHHRYWTNHYHEGANPGPHQRPEGWRTGGGVIARKPPGKL
jgi:hypothetical protein